MPYLLDHLADQAPSIDPDELNRIGCQVMDLHFALRKGEARAVDDDPRSWLYSPQQQRVIFPWHAPGDAVPAERAQGIYRIWFDFLDRLQIGFLKPGKSSYPAQLQRRFLADMRERLTRELVPVSAVHRIHLMGAALRGDVGRYAVPFVCRRQVKAGSDINLLIELDPALEHELPGAWMLHRTDAGGSGCDIYHLGEIPLVEDLGNWQAAYPSIDLTQHLIEAYVFFPSRGDARQMRAFLAEYQAEVFHDRDAADEVQAEQSRIAAQIEANYDLPTPVIERLHEASGNRIYRVEAAGQRLILKMTLDAGSYDWRHLSEHARYEAALIGELRSRGVMTPAVFAARDGLTAQIDGLEAILFECFDGQVCETLEYPVEAAACALAEIHRAQCAKPIRISTRFCYEDLCAIWLPHFERSRCAPDLPAALRTACDTVMPIAERFASAEARAALFARSRRVHCHGDVKPRNSVQRADGSVFLFDFDNALFAPRLSDAVDGAIAFALAEQHIDQADFARCTGFLAAYCKYGDLTAEELADLPAWLQFGALVHFTREITTWVSSGDEIRRRRALAIAGFAAALTAQISTTAHPAFAS